MAGVVEVAAAAAAAVAAAAVAAASAVAAAVAAASSHPSSAAACPRLLVGPALPWRRVPACDSAEGACAAGWGVVRLPPLAAAAASSDWAACASAASGDPLLSQAMPDIAMNQSQHTHTNTQPEKHEQRMQTSETNTLCTENVSLEVFTCDPKRLNLTLERKNYAVLGF